MACRSLTTSLTIPAAMSLAVVPATAQPRTSSGAAIEIGGFVEGGDTATLPRTPWGDLDLQGVWNNSTTTPLERTTTEERARARLAQETVTRATGGTGAGWLELAGELDREALIVGPARRQDLDDARGDAAADRPGACPPWTRRGRFLARPQLLGALHLADVAHRDDSEHLQRELSHLADADARGDRHGDDSRGASFLWTGAHTLTIPYASGLAIPRGHWEGDTLVVETIHFNDRLDGGDLQPSHIIQTTHRGSGGTLRLVERFTLSDVKHHRLPVHGRGPLDIHDALHGRAAHAEA